MFKKFKELGFILAPPITMSLVLVIIFSSFFIAPYFTEIDSAHQYDALNRWATGENSEKLLPLIKKAMKDGVVTDHEYATIEEFKEGLDLIKARDQFMSVWKTIK